jgi:hypothetical protein
MVYDLSTTKQDVKELMNFDEKQGNLFTFLKLIFNVAPILNNQCQLDSLCNQQFKYENQNFKNVIGLSFNNELYYQLSKGMIHPDLLEWVANQSGLSGSFIAPSMYIKQIWDHDEDYKVYKDQIFTNLHETHENPDRLSINLQYFY